MFSASVDTSAVIGLLDRVAQSADFVCIQVGRDTAQRIVAEAQRRVKRATGDTASEIHFELTRDGKGYVVLAYREGVGPAPVDLYLEYGTMYQYAQPFFMQAGMLEEGPHLRRLTAELQKWLDVVGR